MARAIVTGVSRSGGIGAAIARRLAADGFELFLTGWSPHDPERGRAPRRRPHEALRGPRVERQERRSELLRDPLAAAGFLAVRLPSPNAGRIVLFSSGQYYSAMPTQLPYIASKAVVQQLTASLAVELAPRNVTVNCIDPGPNATGYATDELQRAVEAAMPTGRWGTPTDAARLVSWLCSDESDWVTGQTIASDGGFSAR